VFAHGIAIAGSIYHAALMSVKRNYSNGLSFQSNYTFSRFLNNASYFRRVIIYLTYIQVR
jgi:hypothetical protein